MDFEDDEPPPLLVDVEDKENAEDEAKPVKVPITIVTGTSHASRTMLYLTWEP
jgi:hypothetical protein